MSDRALFHVTASALVISGVSLAIGLIVHPMPPYAETVATATWAVSHLFFWIGAMTGIAGLTGAYLRQRVEVGVLGFAGTVLAVSGLTVLAGSMFFEAFIAPSVAARAPALFESFPAGGGWEGFLAGVIASGALFGVGFILFGVATIRADVFPRWAMLLALIGGVPFAVNFLLPRPIAMASVTLFAIGLGGLGVRLWRSVGPAGSVVASGGAAASRA